VCSWSNLERVVTTRLIECATCRVIGWISLPLYRSWDPWPSLAAPRAVTPIRKTWDPLPAGTSSTRLGSDRVGMADARVVLAGLGAGVVVGRTQRARNQHNDVSGSDDRCIPNRSYAWFRKTRVTSNSGWSDNLGRNRLLCAWPLGLRLNQPDTYVATHTRSNARRNSRNSSGTASHHSATQAPD